MEEAERRRIRVVLCTSGGDVLGALPPFDASPWWRDTTEPVRVLRDTYGIEATILRLLSVDGSRASGRSNVTVLAEVDGDATGLIDNADDVTAEFGDVLADHPLRQAYARPGGPKADLRWALAALVDRGTPATGRAEQQRTWNLSSIWRIPTPDAPTWLKVVPPFFAHEGAMIHEVGSALPEVPQVLASEGARLLLADVPGEDQYDAPLAILASMVRTLVAAQSALASNVDGMLATGCFDWRVESFIPRAVDVVRRHADELDVDARGVLRALLVDLPTRFQSLESCGIPTSLVHGDFHPGNVRGDAETLVILDWGDSGVGNPLLDQAAFLSSVPEHDRAELSAEWAAAWKKEIPDCDPDRAAKIVKPIAALRLAMLYQLFLDQIEPSEHVYHASDPVIWLKNAAAAEQES